MNRLARYFLISLILAGLPLPLHAQDYEQDDYTSDNLVEGTDDQYDFTDGQIDQLVAPIALYPDPLLANVLMASTYPLQIVAAHRWLQDNGHVQLTGEPLSAALENMPWAPSVKALVAFPDVLALLDDNLSWTEQLGQAFADQEQDVMDSVQRLRRTAFEQGTLTSTPQQQVAWSGNIVTIAPVSPQIIYVPVYSPLIVYRAWPWVAYPPYVFRYSRNIVFYTSRPILFTHGTVVVSRLNFIKHLDWHNRHIVVDRDRYTRLTRARPPIFQHDVWQPDRDFHHDFQFQAQRGRHPEQKTQRTIVAPSPTSVPRTVTAPAYTTPSQNRLRHNEPRRETIHPQVQTRPQPQVQPQLQTSTPVAAPQAPPHLIRQETLQIRPVEQRREHQAPSQPVPNVQQQPQAQQQPQLQAPTHKGRRDRNDQDRRENRNSKDSHTNDHGDGYGNRHNHD